MEKDTRVNSLTTSEKVEALSSGRMAEGTMETGAKASSMA